MKHSRPQGRLWPVVVTTLVLLGLSLPAYGGKVKPNSKNAQLEFGVKMARLGLWSEALFRFRQAERHEPNNAKVINNIAVAYEAIGQFERAYETYQRGIKAAPGNADMKRNYARFVEFYRNFKAEADEEEDGAVPSRVKRKAGDG
jgi:Tfp pilus assembly protein PilF